MVQLRKDVSALLSIPLPLLPPRSRLTPQAGISLQQCCLGYLDQSWQGDLLKIQIPGIRIMGHDLGICILRTLQ